MFALERVPFLSSKPAIATAGGCFSILFSQRSSIMKNVCTPAYKPNFSPIGNSRNNGFVDKAGNNAIDSVSCFRLVSYNILAQSYVKSTFFPHSPSPCLRWKARSKAILERLLSFDADILCLQELDEFESFFKGHLDTHGYSSIYVKRPGRKKDGCGIFFRRARISLMESSVIQYNDLVPQFTESDLGQSSSKAFASPNRESHGDETGDRGDPNDPSVRLKRDCVGIIAAFKASQAQDAVFVVANTHIYWDPDWLDVKLAQAKHLVECVSDFQSLLANKSQVKIPVIVCGDFNSTPGDAVYNHLTSINECLPNDSTASSTSKGAKVCMRLHSLYASVNKEPDFTNYTPDFTGTLDYIFFSSWDTLRPVSLLEVPLAESEELKGGLPNYNHPSDHLPIGADIRILAR